MRPVTRYLKHHHLALVAVFLALGGSAYAIKLGRNSVKSKQIAPGAVKTSELGADAATGDKVKESSLGPVPNAAAAANADQLDGRDSSAFGYGVLSGRIVGLPAVPATLFASASGNSATDPSSADVEQVWPNAPGVVRNLKVLLKGGISTGTLLFEFQVGGTGGPTLPCGPILAGQFSCASPAGQSLSVPAGSTIWMRIKSTGNPDEAEAAFGVQVGAP